mgnify:CR=1 FL=1
MKQVSVCVDRVSEKRNIRGPLSQYRRINLIAGVPFLYPAFGFERPKTDEEFCGR